MSAVDDLASGDTSVTDRRARTVMAGMAIGLVVVMILGIWAMLGFVSDERERDMQSWQVRLGIVADSRAAAVEGWLEQHFHTVKSLAENASLQIYLTELNLDKDEGEKLPLDIEAAELEYLQNLLIVAADQGGFSALQPSMSVNANVTPAGQTGIAITDATGKLLVATPDMPASTPRIRDALNQAASGEPVFIDMFQGTAGVSIGFVVPVYAVQADTAGSKNIGFVVGLKLVGASLYKQLEQPGEAEGAAETVLLRRSGNKIEYISPLADGSPPLKKRFAADTPELASVFVTEKPGGFAEKRDYNGKQVLVTGRVIVSAPWYIMRKIDADTALAGTRARSNAMITVFVLVIVGLGITIIAVWRHGTSLRAARSAQQYRDIAEELDGYSRFLSVVTDGHPAEIAVIDEKGLYTFVNQRIADQVGLEKQDIIGKSMPAVIGPVKSKILEAANAEVFENHKAMIKVVRFDGEGEEPRTIQAHHIPIKGKNDISNAVLMILEDITEAVTERERRERVMRKLVSTLVSLVDRRDPYSAHQSQRVASVATAIAREMGLGDDDVRTVDLAGNLMNLGKVLISPELLTKTDRLTKDELQNIRECVLSGADLLEGLEFDVPVGATVRDLQEYWDGSGYPKGLKGEDIRLGARIISVANAFVGMVSPRAYRDAMSFTEAENELMAAADRAFDRRVILALLNFIENRGGREDWKHFGERTDQTEEE